MEVENDEFWKLEHDGWERAAQNYERYWTDHTFPFIPPLLKAVSASTGTRLLDVACGPGYVSEQASRHGAVPIGVEFSQQMVLMARRRNPDLDFRLADAHKLPFESKSFDAVTMSFGVLHLAKPEVAFAEIFRVLGPNGTFGFTVWAKPDQNPGAKAMVDAIDRYANSDVNLPEGPSYFRFSEVQECRRALHESGFASSTLAFSTVTAEWRVPSADFLFRAERDAGVRTAALLARQSPEQLAAIQSATENAIQQFSTDEGYAIPMAAHIVSVNVDKNH
jgi:ubiquinone/menaquinone biosynthesis C-methylase UbiE